MRMSENTEQSLTSAIMASIDNYRFQRQHNATDRTNLYKAKYICWIGLSILFSPRIKINNNRFVAVITSIGEKRIEELYPNEDIFRFARLNDSFANLMLNRSVLSPYGRLKRIGVLCDSLAFFWRHRNELKKYVHFSIEYYFIANYLCHFSIDEIVFQGVYDRYNTFFSYIGKALGIRLVAVQDGACIVSSIPRKLHCDKVFCFNEFEEENYRKIVESNSCEYVHIGYRSLIKWSRFYDSSKFIIGIASQDWLTSKTMEIIDALMNYSQSKEYIVILFPHYRESLLSYQEVIKKYPQLIVEDRYRYSNINVLITYYSTIVYDFWNINEDIKIVCYRIPGFDAAYYKSERVHICQNTEELISEVFI